MFKNLKIAPKLILCFIIVAIISSLSGVIGFVLMKKSDADYSKALVENGFALGDIGNFNTYLNKGAATVRDIVLLTDPADIANAQKELSDIIAVTEDALEQLKATCQTDKELSLIKVFDQKFPEYKKLREEVIRLGEQNKNDEALNMFRSEAQPVLTEIMDAAQELMELNEQIGTQVSVELTREAQTAMFIIIFVVIAAIIISVIFAVWIAHSISRPIGSVKDAAAQLAQGNLDIHLDTTDAKDEVSEMSRSFSNAANMLQNYITDINRGLSSIAQGNFDIRPGVTYMGDFKALEDAILTIITSLSQTMGQINESADQVSSGSEQVSNGAQALSQGATEQASSVEELAATINEISGQIQKTASNATSASDKAQSVGDEMLRSNEQMQTLISAIRDISDSSGEIGKIIKTIEDIAFQTNILALNAAVEAARAGAAGKGFAVVADEVRNLASKSAEASKNTAALIENSIRSVEHGTSIADETAQTLSDAVTGVNEVVSLVTEISTASVEQADSIAQITQGIDQISSVVQTNSATAEESAAASEELSGQATILRELVGRFKLLSMPGAGTVGLKETAPSESYQQQAVPSRHISNSQQRVSDKY